MSLGWRRILAPGGRLYLPWASLGLVVLVCGLYALPHSVFDALVFERRAVDAGAFYRLVTGNFVHYDIYHLFYDAVPFAIVGPLYEHDRRRSLKILMLVGLVCLATGIWGYWGPDHLERFAGLSAACYGVLVVVAFDLHRETRQWLPLVVLVFYIGRVVVGATWYDPDEPFHTWHSAHAVALAIGFAWVAAEAIQRRFAASGSSRLSTTASYL
jgi:membrane associated rhomboid family serine protease